MPFWRLFSLDCCHCFFLVRNRSLGIGSHPPDLRHVSGRISADFWPAAASAHCSHIFPCQNPFSGRFTVFRAFCGLLPAMLVRASLLRLPRYFGQQVSSARKLCLQSRTQQRQTWLNFLRPVVGSIKKLQYSLSLFDILGMVSPPFFFWLQHIGTDFSCVFLRLSIRSVPCPGVSPRRCSARQSGCVFAESYLRPMSGIQLSRCEGI